MYTYMGIITGAYLIGVDEHTLCHHLHHWEVVFQGKLEVT